MVEKDGNALRRTSRYLKKYAPEHPFVLIFFPLLVALVVWVAAYLPTLGVVALLSLFVGRLGYSLPWWADWSPEILATIAALTGVFLYGFDRGVTGHREHLATHLGEAQALYEAVPRVDQPELSRQLSSAMRPTLEKWWDTIDHQNSTDEVQRGEY